MILVFPLLAGKLLILTERNFYPFGLMTQYPWCRLSGNPLQPFSRQEIRVKARESVHGDRSPTYADEGFLALTPSLLAYDSGRFRLKSSIVNINKEILLETEYWELFPIPK